MTSDKLSTGEVARLCGVTRDAVVKWIKKGKLQATRTPGGHYRIAREVCLSLPTCSPEVEAEVDGPSFPKSARREPRDPDAMRCWEYFGEADKPRDTCLGCLVYLARAQKCYRLAELGEESGHRLHFCRTDCRTCAFYRACQGLATEVLIVTRDEALAHRIQMRADPGAISVRFARSGYEASAIISTFSPALIVLDSGLAEVRDGHLLRSLLQDDRIPGAGVAVATREGDEIPRGVQGIHTLRAPFTTKDIEALAAAVAGGLGRAPKDVA